MRQILPQGLARALIPTLLASLVTASPIVARAADPNGTQAPSDPHQGPRPGDTGHGLLGGLVDLHEALLILDGNFYHDGIGGYGPLVLGEAYQPTLIPAAADTAARSPADAEDGFNFRAAELSLQATLNPSVDLGFRASAGGTGFGKVGLENAWVQTRGLPLGLRLRVGKFNSDIGYLNKYHPHDWDFVDQNLPYLDLLGESLIDSGAQLAWLPDLPLKPMLGAELFQGDQEVLGATLNNAQQRALGLDRTVSGPRLWTAFAKLAPELGERHSLRLGVSYAHNRQHQEVQPYAGPAVWPYRGLGGGLTQDPVDETVTGDLGLAGQVDLWGLDLVYKRRGGGVQGRGDFKLQAEYLRTVKHLDIRSSPVPGLLALRPTVTTDGLYAQALYGFAPRWTAGLRYDILGLTNQVSGGPLGASFGSSDRWTLAVTWNFWKTSKLRAQYARNDILVAPGTRERFDAFYLQLLLELGKREEDED